MRISEVSKGTLVVLALVVGEASRSGKTERDRFVGEDFDTGLESLGEEVPRSVGAEARASVVLHCVAVVGLALFVGEEGSLPMVVAT